MIANTVVTFLDGLEHENTTNHSIPTKFSQVINLMYQTDTLGTTFNSSFNKY